MSVPSLRLQSRVPSFEEKSLVVIVFEPTTLMFSKFMLWLKQGTWGLVTLEFWSKPATAFLYSTIWVFNDLSVCHSTQNYFKLMHKDNLRRELCVIQAFIFTSHGDFTSSLELILLNVWCLTFLETQSSWPNLGVSSINHLATSANKSRAPSLASFTCS